MGNILGLWNRRLIIVSVLILSKLIYIYIYFNFYKKPGKNFDKIMQIYFWKDNKFYDFSNDFKRKNKKMKQFDTRICNTLWN